MAEFFIETWQLAHDSPNTSELSPTLSESSRPKDCSLSALEGINVNDQKQQDIETLIMVLNHLDHSNQVTHDKEIKQGVATFLIQLLHSTLRRTSTLYRDRLEKSRALRVSIITVALEMALRCSGATIYEFVDTMPIETLPTLVILVEIFIAEKQSIIRDAVLHKVARILNRLCTNGLPIRIVVIEALFLLLKGPTDTRIDASCALASLAARARRNEKLHRSTISRIEQISPSLISTLSIAASSLPGDQVEDIYDALLSLTDSSDSIVVNIAKRFAAVRVLHRGMLSVFPEVRRNSDMASSNLLKSNSAFAELFAAQPVNGEILAQGLAKAAVIEEEPELQHFAICTLGWTFANMNGSLYHIEIIIDALAKSQAPQFRTEQLKKQQ